MKTSDSSVAFYAKGIAAFPVYFPHGKADCRHCGFCYYAEPFALYRCRLTDDFIERTDLDYRHTNCPIKFDETEF